MAVSSNELNCFYTNANSLRGKMDELRYRTSTAGFDVVGITETWADSSVTDAELALEGFDMFRVDRGGSRGGGVLLYTKEELGAVVLDNPSEFREQVWCSLKLKSSSLLLGLCYRSPNSDKNNNDLLLRSLEKMMAKRGEQRILVMGDFNYPGIDFSNFAVNGGANSDENRFYDKIQDLFLIQNVTEATRVREGQIPSLLDYVFTDEENVVDEMICEVPLGKSDHVCITWKLKMERQEAGDGRMGRLDYYRGDYGAIGAALELVDWAGRMVDEVGLEAKWNFFKQTVSDLVNKHVPKKRINKQRVNKSKWITSGTKREMKRRAKAWSVYKNYESDKNYRDYKMIRNRVTSLVRRDQDDYRKQLLSSFKGNEKRFYGYICQLQTRPTGVAQLRGGSGELTVNDGEAAEVLSSYFQEVYTRDAPGIQAPQAGKDRTDRRTSEEDLVILPHMVENALLKLKTDKSPGPDNLHPMVLSRCAAAVSVPLSMIYNESIATGEVPEDWKLANITPLFKKGKKNDPANYRPVSLTSVVCKVLEGLIRVKLVEHLERSNMFSNSQHGFMAGRSCLTNLLETFENWTTALDEGYGLDVLFLDYRKAFDTVSHRRLIAKLREYGVDGKLLKWIQDFLSSRKSRVGVRGSFSCWRDVLSGVPQGSVLGPLLFLIFVNDLPEWIKCSLKMFADDTKIWAKIRSSQDSCVLQADLDSLMRWSDEWLMKFNCDKCKVMHIGHSLDTEYYMTALGKTTKLEVITEEKDLGVIIANNLKPSLQCSKAAAKSMSVLGLIARHFRRLDRQDFLLLYKTYVRPHLEYCIQVWSPYLVKDIETLEKVQRRATKLVGEIKKWPYEKRLQYLGLTTLNQRRKRGDMIEVYKLLTGKERIDSGQFFQLASTSHGLRGHSLKLATKRSRLEIRRSFFSNRVIRDWNALPQSAIDATTVNAFKNQLDHAWMGAFKA